MTMINLAGYGGVLFPDQYAFKITVRKLIDQYCEPSRSCVSLIKDILISSIEASGQKRFKSYPRFEQEVSSLIKKKIADNEEITVKHLMTHIEAQKAFMNTKHPLYSPNTVEETTSSVSGGPGSGLALKNTTEPDSGYAVVKWLTSGQKPNGDSTLSTVVKSMKLYISKDYKHHQVLFFLSQIQKGHMGTKSNQKCSLLFLVEQIGMKLGRLGSNGILLPCRLDAISESRNLYRQNFVPI